MPHEIRPVHVSFVALDSEDEESAELADQAEKFFRARGVRLHSRYAGFLVIVEKRKIIAAAAVAPDEREGEVEFSVATSPDRERRGLARLLVGEVLRWARQWARTYEIESDEVKVTAEVINDTAIPPLLASMGFQDLGQRMWERKIPAF